MYMIINYLNLIKKDKQLGFIALSMTDKVKTANAYIKNVCNREFNPALNMAIYRRLEKGKEQYGHELRPLDDTTTWGTKQDSWLEMAEEEIADAIFENHINNSKG